MTSGPRVAAKWRPPLAVVVFAVLLSVLALPSGFIIAVRLLDAEPGGPGPLEIGVLVVSLLLTLVIAYVLTRTVTRPLEALIARARAITTGGRDAIRPLPVYGTAEIATLSQSFLDLASRLMDRTEYMRSFAAHVSHELKSPLTAIKGSAELMRDDGAMTEAERQRFLDHIIADADRLDALVRRLRELAEAEMPLTGGETSLVAVVPALSERFPDVTIEVTGAALRLALPGETLGIVLGHLADNAAQHGATRLELAAAAGDAVIEVTVADNGNGISEGNRDRIFQPFFSTRRDSGGTGMGLDIARAMLRAQGAEIDLLPSTEGACFRITIPLH
ncbi:MAG TPA: HAMP domain-containing sensor histidine kinase [Devosiaceae bacterium]|nr:HAMP domain-containing sensor histidine kinase [Devosiaceae bacterium]